MEFKEFKEPEGLSESDAKAMKDLFDQFVGCVKGFADENESIKESLSNLEKSLTEKGISKESIEAIKQSIQKQGEAIKKMQEGEIKQSKGITEREQVKSFLAANMKGIKELGKGSSFEVEIKAATPMLVGSSISDAPHAFSIELDRSVHYTPKEPPVFLQTLNKGTTNSRTIMWINRVGEEGGSAFIGEGVLKPLKSWTHKEESSTAKKVAVRVKLSTEMLEDSLYVESEIEPILTEDIYNEVDAKLLSGNGTDEPDGIINNSSGYVGNSLDGTIPFANNVDAIRASVLQLRLLNHKADTLYLNPVEYASIDLLKSEAGNYIKIEVDGLLRNLRVVETAEIPQGRFLLLDSSKRKVRIYKGKRLEFWRSEDDFDKNMITVICEMRLHSYMSSVDLGSVMYEQFSVIKAALNKTA